MLMLILKFVKAVYMAKHIDVSLEPESDQQSQVKLYILMFVDHFVIHSQIIDTLFCSKTITVVFALIIL